MAERAPLRVTRVDDSGVHLTSDEDTVVDVLFDGRRIWSFWTLRDSDPGDGGRVAEWPPPLRALPRRHDPALGGRARLGPRGLRRGGQPRHAAPTGSPSWTPPAGRSASTSPTGSPPTFDTRDRDAARAPLLDSTEQVLVRAARGRGGCVPGVRHPARRRPRAGLHRPRQRRRPRLRQPAHAPARRDPGVLPAAAPPARTWVTRSTATAPLRSRSRCSRPTAPFAGSTCSAATSCNGQPLPDGGDRHAVRGGVDLPARDLHARRPDAAGAGAAREAPGGDVRAELEGARPGLPLRHPAHDPPPAQRVVPRDPGQSQGVGRGATASVRETLPPKRPSALAHTFSRQEGALARLVDVGAGRGADALWFARKGVPALALDYSRGAANAVAAPGGGGGSRPRGRLDEPPRAALGARPGSPASRGCTGPPTLLANHLIDSTDQRGLEALARFARMALSGGGRLYADFDALRPGERYAPPGPRDATRPKNAERVLRTLRESGAVIVQSTQVHDTRPHRR